MPAKNAPIKFFMQFPYVRRLILACVPEATDADLAGVAMSQPDLPREIAEQFMGVIDRMINRKHRTAM